MNKTEPGLWTTPPMTEMCPSAMNANLRRAGAG